MLGGLEHAETFALEDPPDESSDRVLILDHQNDALARGMSRVIAWHSHQRSISGA